MNKRDKENIGFAIGGIVLAGVAVVGFMSAAMKQRHAYEDTVELCKEGSVPQTPRSSPLLRKDPYEEGVKKALAENPACTITPRP